MPIGFEHHRKSETDVNVVNASEIGGGAIPITTDSLIGRVAIGTTETEIKVGASPLAERKELLVINDSSYFVFIALTATFATDNAFFLFPGESITFDLDSSTTVNIYGKTTEGTANIRIAEIK